MHQLNPNFADEINWYKTVFALDLSLLYFVSKQSLLLKLCLFYYNHFIFTWLFLSSVQCLNMFIKLPIFCLLSHLLLNYTL